MLVGRLISIGIIFLSQVLVVRYLSKTDYGVLEYLLSIIRL